MVKDYSDSEREIPSCHMGYTFRLAASVILYAHTTDKIAHTTAFVTAVMEHWMERKIA